MRVIGRMAASAAAAATMLAATPGFAADDLRQTGAGERRSGAFVGLSARLPVGTARPQRGSLRLQLSSVHDYRDPAGASLRSQRAPGLEIGFDRSGRPITFVGGRELRPADDRLQASGSTTWLIVGGVVVALVVVLAAIASAQPTAGPPDGAFD